MDIIIELIITMAFSAFFSGMEIAFVSSNKLRFEMEKSNNFSTKILTVFYQNPNNFISRGVCFFYSGFFWIFYFVGNFFYKS